MHTAHSFTVRGYLCDRYPLDRNRPGHTPGQSPPDRDLPEQRPPLWTENPLPLDRITDICENITLPQTS